MNAVLPAGIESYLKEAGFSATEMLLLRKLVDQDALTVRELASKTGKSTGVLDQAMKKLLMKKIVQRSIVNDHPRYSIQSLDAVVRWVKDDMKVRQENLVRKHENFEQFIASLKMDKKRPDIEHFNGMEGIKQAYLKLIDSGQELLTFTPITTLTEDDPFRLFRVELFRKRQVRKIFQRILAPDTSLARKFQSRDPFEYRKTLLLPESDLPLTFERTIVGDTIACFNFKEETACFIKYAELAVGERAAFEAMWLRAQKGEQQLGVAVAVPLVIPLSTRVLSAVREFVLGRRSIAAFVILALISAALTFGLHRNNSAVNLERMRERVTAIAATAAPLFNANELDVLRTEEDWKRPEWANTVNLLKDIRLRNKNILFVYIFKRSSGDPNKLEFVADSHSINPYANTDDDLSNNVDVNGDGKIENDGPDYLQWPGQKYPTAPPVAFHAFNGITASKEFYEDQWGKTITGYAPIYNSKGEAVAVLAIDMAASVHEELDTQSFSAAYVFLGFLFLFMLIRFVTEYRFLLLECCDPLKKNIGLTILSLIFLMLAIGFSIYGFKQYQRYRLLEEAGQRLQAIAVAGATEFNPDDLRQLHFVKDMETDAYQRVFMKLNDIRDANEDIKYAYIFRQTGEPNMYEFIADADSNYNLPFLWSDFNKDGMIDQSDENVAPGVSYYDAHGLFQKAIPKGAFGEIIDQWGHFISGIAPIYDAQGQLVGLLGLDMDVN